MEATAIGYGPEPATLHLLLHCDSICLLTTICNGLTFVPQLLDVLDACSHLFEFQLVDCARRKFACAGPLDDCLCLFVRGFISGARICWTRKRVRSHAKSRRPSAKTNLLHARAEGKTTSLCVPSCTSSPLRMRRDAKSPRPEPDDALGKYGGGPVSPVRGSIPAWGGPDRRQTPFDGPRPRRRFSS